MFGLYKTFLPSTGHTCPYSNTECLKINQNLSLYIYFFVFRTLFHHIFPGYSRTGRIGISFALKNVIMFKNYIKVAVRNILKHKGYSLLNIFGLAVGMACCLLILVYIRDELSLSQQLHLTELDIYFSKLLQKYDF